MTLFKKLGKLICYMPKYYADALNKIAIIEENYNKIRVYSDCNHKEMSRCKELINYLGCTTTRNNSDTIISIQECVIRELFMNEKLDEILIKIERVYS